MLVMRKWYPNILVLLMVFLAVTIGSCTRASTPKPIELEITQGLTPTQVIDITGATTTQPAVEPTVLATSPTTGVAYPLPAEQGTMTATSNAYPRPPDQDIALTATTIPPEPTLSITPPPQVQEPQASQAPYTDTPTATVLPSATETTPPTPTTTVASAYPGPEINPTSDPGQGYPAPQNTNTQPAYPGPQKTNTQPAYPSTATSTPRPTQTTIKSPTPKTTGFATLVASPTPTVGTGTPRVTATEQPPRPPLSPPPPGSSITIWHSWSFAKTEILQSVIQSFKKQYPELTFTLLYVPLDDLYTAYYDATYLGQGPDLLLGPSEWGPDLFKEQLITDLTPYLPDNFLENISQPALSSGVYDEALISLPLSQHGQLMFRNIALIASAPTTMDELISLSQQATRGGMVGSYLERGSYFSSPAIIGLGGRLMDEMGYPVFNDQYGLEWLELLEAYDVAGAVTFNTNWDLEKFKQSKVGIIIDGSWNISMLAQTIGVENLAIDPWPTYGTGHLSGWVETDSVYLNANTTGNNMVAAFSFMGYLLDPNVQMRFAEVGDIPTVITTQPRDPLIKQAMTAFINGAPYPNTQDNTILTIYRNELDIVIKKVFYEGADPELALQTAADNITRSINNLSTLP
jgi:maltose-binding protein MalE